MARVYTQKAGKDYPEAGIKKGDMYYSWSFRYGGEHKSLTPPRPSQLTQSKMSAALAAAEVAEDITESADNPEDIVAVLNEAAGTIRDVADEYQEAADAFENGGALAEQNSDKADDLNEWADSLESDASDIEGMSVSDYIDDDHEVEGKKGDDRGVSSFEDLSEAEQVEYLAAARELAMQNISSPI